MFLILLVLPLQKGHHTVCNLWGLIFSLNIVLRFTHVVARHCGSFLLAAIHHPQSSGYLPGLGFAIVKVLQSILLFICVRASLGLSLGGVL